MEPIQPANVATLTTAIVTLTRHLLTLTQLTEQLGEGLPLLSQQITALQTTILDLVDLVETLQRRIDRLEPKGPTFGRVQ